LLHNGGCHLDTADYDDRTVGHLAACEGHMDILEFLIKETNYSFEMKDRWNNTAFNDLKHDK